MLESTCSFSMFSMFIQLPLIVSKAPEGWSLPSYLSIIKQLGNIGPLCYTLFQKYSPRKLKDSYVIYALCVIGCTASILMAFLFEKTAIVGGESRSVALMAVGFCFALVGCTSSVLFMPYMGRFREIYLITYLIGELLSGFLASIMALIQGVGGAPECRLVDPDSSDPEYTKYTSPPRFETKEFFIFVFAMKNVSVHVIMCADMECGEGELSRIAPELSGELKLGLDVQPQRRTHASASPSVPSRTEKKPEKTEKDKNEDSVNLEELVTTCTAPLL